MLLHWQLNGLLENIMDCCDFRPLLLAFVFSTFFGITIEILQSEYTLTRSADMMDFLANSLGATSAIIAVLLFNKIKTKMN